MPANLLDRQFEAERPYVSAVIDLFSRRVVGRSMSASVMDQVTARG